MTYVAETWYYGDYQGVLAVGNDYHELDRQCVAASDATHDGGIEWDITDIEEQDP